MSCPAGVAAANTFNEYPKQSAISLAGWQHFLSQADSGSSSHASPLVSSFRSYLTDEARASMDAVLVDRGIENKWDYLPSVSF